MPSENRLHPSSVLFSLAAQARNLAVPGVLVLFGASRAGADWEPWLMLFLIPYSVFALVRYLSFRYRYEPNEIVIRSGLVFRNERHVPYARIQNLDAVQNIAHRLLGVVEVRVQTGGGTEPEVVLSVVPVAALDEMRRRVFEGRMSVAAPALPEAGAEQPLPAEGARLILQLSPRDLLLAGFIENRGVVLIAAGFGVLWEMGFADPMFERIFGEDATGRGIIRQLATAVFGGIGLSPRRVAVTLAAFVGLFIFIRLLSMLWAAVRLYGFRLTRDADDLRIEFGLLTRVAATIPLRRIQTLTIRQGPLHTLFGRVAVKVETAGGHGGEDGEREERRVRSHVAGADHPARRSPGAAARGAAGHRSGRRRLAGRASARLPPRLQELVAVCGAGHARPHVRAAVVDSRAPGSRRRLGIHRRAAIRAARRMGDDRPRRGVSDRMDLEANHRGAVRKDSGGDAQASRHSIGVTGWRS